MSHYKQQEYDFINRTKAIIKQYDSFEKSKDENYRVTLLLNCMVGLLILPQQEWYSRLPNDIVSIDKWGITPEWITTSNDDKTVKNVARHLRNSVAHYNFEDYQNNSTEISRIVFYDKDPRNNNELTFKAIIPIENIKKFVFKLSDILLTEMEINK